MENSISKLSIKQRCSSFVIKNIFLEARQSCHFVLSELVAKLLPPLDNKNSYKKLFFIKHKIIL